MIVLVIVHVLVSPALIVPLHSADLVVVSVCPDGSVNFYMN